MKYRIIIKDEALAGALDFLKYIADRQQMPETAERWWNKALDKLDTLEIFPHRCPIAPQNAYSKYELRMLIVDRCYFVFHVNDEDRVVEVVEFRHGSRDS